MPDTPIPAAYEDLRLDELLHIMDAATSLRKERETAALVLGEQETRRRLRDKLMQTAAATGEELTPAEVDAAIARYFDALHDFPEPESRFQVLLARAYIRRGLVLSIVGGAMVWCAAAAGLFLLPGAPFNSKTRAAKALEELWSEVDARRGMLVALAEDPETDARIEALGARASSLRATGDVGEIETIGAQLRKLEARLKDRFDLRVASPTGGESAISLSWEDDEGARDPEFYLIVEAVDDAGRPVKVRIRDAETGNESDVSRWAELVPEEVYARLANDKQSDGVLDERRFGIKRRGSEEIQVLIANPDGTPVARRRQLVRW